MSLRPEFKALFFDLHTPLRAPLLLHPLKAKLLIQMPRRVETVKSPQVHAAVATLTTEFDRRRQQHASEPHPSGLPVRNKPTQVGPPFLSRGLHRWRPAAVGAIIGR